MVASLVYIPVKAKALPHEGPLALESTPLTHYSVTSTITHTAGGQYIQHASGSSSGFHLHTVFTCYSVTSVITYTAGGQHLQHASGSP